MRANRIAVLRVVSSLHADIDRAAVIEQQKVMRGLVLVESHHFVAAHVHLLMRVDGRRFGRRLLRLSRGREGDGRHRRNGDESEREAGEGSW